MPDQSAEMVDVDPNRLKEVARRAEASLEKDDAELIRRVFESYEYVTDLLNDKDTGIRRLRKLFFGAKTEKTDSVVGESPEGKSPGDEDDGSNEDPDEPEPPPPKPGHGRNRAAAYEGGEQIAVPHGTLEPGDRCPDCRRGTLYEQRPSVIVRIVGQAPLHSRVYHLQKVRCHTCGALFTAKLPADAGPKKYDVTSASMMALLKYGSGMPFNRLQGLQRNLRIPLPASTQWDVVKSHALLLAPVYDELIRQAAQGDLLQNDDTTVKILEFMGERARKVKTSVDPDRARRGLYTSGVVSTCDGHRIALFFSGQQHAGENLADVLARRAEGLAPPIQMCDALSRNIPGALRTILANCLAHGRRRFVDVHDRFPDECRFVLESLKVVYHNDAVAKEKELTPEQRLEYHRTESQETVDALHTWLKQQFAEKRVEPNSALGECITYMLNHWHKLTLFLREPGAPLDNNLCERLLKRAILHRKNALFYRSLDGAHVGDLYMSLIHTCELCGVNSFDYLTALLRHADNAQAQPDEWMPWSYRSALGALPSAA